VVNAPIGVLALQGDVREHRNALEDLGATTVAVRTAEEMASVRGLVIPGGESTTMSLLAHRLGLVEPLQQAVAKGMPMYGSCAGMIVLATDVLDGRPDQVCLGALDITVRRNAFGRQVDSFESRLVMPVLGDTPIEAVFIRAPWVERVGPDVEVIGTTDDSVSPDRVVAVRNERYLATSFHPEISDDRRIHELFLDMVEAAAGDDLQTQV